MGVVASDVQADLAGLQEALLKTDSVEQFLHELAVLAVRTASDSTGSAGVLRTASQNTNVKLRDLAATIVTNVSGEPPKPTAPFENG